MKKAGIWVGNGRPTDANKMLSWNPGTVTCIYDYMGDNQIPQYKRRNPSATAIIRFMHPKNWLDDIPTSARNYGTEIGNKWKNDAVLRETADLVYIANELNLWVECGGRAEDQLIYESEAHYQRMGDWLRQTMTIIKDIAPDIPLCMPPLAYGHKEDGDPINGIPQLGYAGYDYLQGIGRNLCDGNFAAHYYWGNGGGSVKNWLYDEEESTWHAFRFERVIELFQKRYGWTPKIWIDECGNFAPQDADFTDQCLYFANRALSNPHVGGITFFLWEDAMGGNKINEWVSNISDIDTHIARLGALEIEEDEGNQGVEPMDIFRTFDESKDVLADNLRAHQLDGNGKVVGSVARIASVDTVQQHLDPNNMPKAGDYYWRVIRAALIDEDQAKGDFDIVVNYIDENGVPMGGAKGWFMYPTDRLSADNWIGVFDNGNGNGDVFITSDGTLSIAQGKNDFNPPTGSENMGPYIVGYAGEYTEIIAGFGMPYNRHVKYTVTFQRTKYNDSGGTEPPTDPTQPVECNSPIAKRLIKIVKAIFC